MDHAILLELVRRKIKDSRVLSLLATILDNGGERLPGASLAARPCSRGLPIGNLTSQFLANVYLDPLDHEFKDRLGVRYYLRYMDDFVVFSNDKRELKRLWRGAEAFLWRRLGLRLKSSRCFINTRTNGLPFLGVRIFPRITRIRRENLRRTLQGIRRTEWERLQGRLDDRQAAQRITSRVAHLQAFDTASLRRRCFGAGGGSGGPS